MPDSSVYFEAIEVLFSVRILLLILLVSIAGIVLGAMPGIGPALAMILFFPFTFGLDPTVGLIVLAVVYGSSTYGGSLSAILINVPGTSGSAATLLDGYPLTRKGMGAFALGVSTTASFVGAFIGLVLLTLFAPLLARAALLFGSAELFALAVFGLSVVSAVSRGSLPRSLTSVGIGAFLASIGSDPMSTTSRFTFGISYLENGVNIVVLMVGLFAISQVIELAYDPAPISRHGELEGDKWGGVRHVLGEKLETVRSSLIGTVIGAIPGVGITAANFISYLFAVRTSDDPDSFGTGNPNGVIAAEAANNGAAMGALIPAMALAIPGGAAAAIFIGLMITYGITPGPSVFEGPLPYSVFAAIFLGNIVFLVAGLLGARQIARVTTFPRVVVLTGIMAFALAGSLAVRNNVLDIGMAVAIGLLAFGLQRRGFSLIPLVMAYILAPIAEVGFRRALLITGGDYSVFVTRPISLVLLVAAAITFGSPILYRLIGPGSADAAPEG